MTQMACRFTTWWFVCRRVILCLLVAAFALSGLRCTNPTDSHDVGPGDGLSDGGPDGGGIEDLAQPDWSIDTSKCDDPPALPAAAGLFIGLEHDQEHTFFDSGFVFDRNGNMLVVDGSGDLLQIHQDGTRQVWVKSVATRARGMAYLSTGELVIADSGLGALIKVYANGEVRTLTPHLDYPHSVEVDRDDTIYVTELSRSTITQVDPKTGAAKVVAQCTRTGLSGLAFSPDFNRLYAASAGSGEVFFIERTGEGKWGPIQTLATLPGAEGPCHGLLEGDPCLLSGSDALPARRSANGTETDSRVPKSEPQPDDDIEDGMAQGTCRSDGFGSLYCRIPQPCDGIETGGACTTADGYAGVCKDDGTGSFECLIPDPCEGKVAGEPCQIEWRADTGICDGDGLGGLVCRERQECDDLKLGDPCEDWGSTGACVESGTGTLTCRVPGVCDELMPGDPCEEYGQEGECQEFGDGTLYCGTIPACVGKVAGDPCVEWDMPGTCEDWGDGDLYCDPIPPCQGKSVGDPCVDWGDDGICREDEDGTLTCVAVPPCHGKALNDECSVWSEPGVCLDDGTGQLFCHIPNPCDGLAIGDKCTSTYGLPGTCGQYEGDPDIYCVEDIPCDGATIGAECISYGLSPGVCVDDLYGGLACQEWDVCEGKINGAKCEPNYSFDEGTCVPMGSRLYCKIPNPCDGLEVGDACVSSWDEDAVAYCSVSEAGFVYCREAEPCDGKVVGDSCRNYDAWPGTCKLDDGGLLYCHDESAQCLSRIAGEACTTIEGLPGICKEGVWGMYDCETMEPCEGQALLDDCVDNYGSSGVCRIGEDSNLTCVPTPPCMNKAPGDPCVTSDSHLHGACQAGAGNLLLCQPGAECEGNTSGDVCHTPTGREGTCLSGPTGVLRCDVGATPGRPHSLTTDGCGNLYVTDDSTDSVWRFPSDGGNPVLVANTRQGQISAMRWGTGKGVWQPETLYLSVAGGAKFVTVDIGLPGRRMVRPLGSSSTPGEVTPPALDCRNLPAHPVAVNQLMGPRGYHDLAFDSEGYVVGFDGFNLIRVDRDGSAQVVATGLGTVEGMDWLPDGSLVVASEAGVTLVAPSGAQVPLATDMRAYGVTVGPDGLVYAADDSRLYRIDPKNQEVEVLLYPTKFGESWVPRTIEFDVDHSLMYIGTLGTSIYVAPVDNDLNILAKPHEFAFVHPEAVFLDGLGVDACGNVFVPNFETRALYRSGPDGVVTLFLQQEAEDYGHGLEWGNGLGGWNNMALYLPQPYLENRVLEVVVGVPKRK